MSRIVLSLLMLTSVTVSRSVVAQDLSYTFTELRAPFPGVDQTGVAGINERGSVVGSYHDSQGDHAYLLQGGDFVTLELPFAGAQDSHASGINSRGDIVGSYEADGVRRGFLLSGGRYTVLEASSLGAISTQPRSINSRGDVVGAYEDASGFHGFLWSSGTFTSLDVPFPGAHDTTAAGINSRGQIVGGYTSEDGRIHGFVLARGEYTPFDEAGAAETLPYGINDSGVIVGTRFIWRRGVFNHVSGTLPDDLFFLTPVAINNRGVILHLAGNQSGQYRSFIGTPD